MDEEVQESEGKSEKSFLKQAKGKAENKLKDEIKKQGKEAGKKFIKFLLKTPWGRWILIALIATTIGIILLVSFLYVIDEKKFKSSSDSTKASVTYASAASSGDSDSEMHTVNVSQGQGGYNITPIYVDVETPEQQDNLLANIRNELSRYGLDASAFSDFELKYLGVLYENGLDYSLYNEEELKALITFLKAEIANKSLDLRSADEMLDENGNYKKVDATTLPEDEVQGIIQIKRSNVKNNTTNNLTYLKEETFNSYIEQGNSEVLNYFTIDGEDNLVVAQWNKITTTYEYEGTLPEDFVKQENLEQYILRATKFPYKEYTNEFTMQYNLLVALLAMTEDVEFCKSVADLAFNSEIIINIQEETTIYTTTTTTVCKPRYQKIWDLNYYMTIYMPKIIGRTPEREPIFEEVLKEFDNEFKNPKGEINQDDITIEKWKNEPLGAIINDPDAIEAGSDYTIITTSTRETNKYTFGRSKADTWILNENTTYGEATKDPKETPGDEKTSKLNQLNEFNEYTSQENVLEEVNTRIEEYETEREEKCNEPSTAELILTRLTIGKFDVSETIQKTDTSVTTYNAGIPTTTSHTYSKDENGNLEKFLLLYSRSTAKDILWKE